MLELLRLFKLMRVLKVVFNDFEIVQGGDVVESVQVAAVESRGLQGVAGTACVDGG